MLKKFIIQCYENWITNEVPINETLCECTTWSRVMKKAFPELIHVGGYVRRKENIEAFFSSLMRLNYHEYLITEDGDIIDPTKIQFNKILGVDNWEYLRCEEHLIT